MHDVCFLWWKNQQPCIYWTICEQKLCIFVQERVQLSIVGREIVLCAALVPVNIHTPLLRKGRRERFYICTDSNTNRSDWPSKTSKNSATRVPLWNALCSLHVFLWAHLIFFLFMKWSYLYELWYIALCCGLSRSWNSRSWTEVFLLYLVWYFAGGVGGVARCRLMPGPVVFCFQLPVC